MARTLAIGQEHELLEKLEEAGLDSELAQKVIASKDNDLAQKLVARLISIVGISFRLVANFDYDKRKDGWTLVYDSKVKDGEFTPQLVKFLQNDEHQITGEETVKRAIELGSCAGQRHAEAMLRNKDKIPAKWAGSLLLFVDTIWQCQDGGHAVPGIYQSREGYSLTFYRLEDGFYQGFRLVRPRKAS